MTSQFAAELRKISPVTRFLCASQLAVSLPVMLRLLPAYRVILVWDYVIKDLQVTMHFAGGDRYMALNQGG